MTGTLSIVNDAHPVDEQLFIQREKRGSGRQQMRAKVVLNVEPVRIEGAGSNISQTGFLINANRWLPVGGVVHLEFQFGPQRQQLACIGCVAWVSGRGPEYQTGIKVIHTDAAQLFEYKKYLSHIPASKRLSLN